ncbi:MAG: hypothetical protein OEV65_12430 [Aquincola sp.]|nr:hypothetical protein [Aquincola sp.]
MRRVVPLTLAAGLLATAAAGAETQPWVQLRLDREAVASVWVYIDAKDCPGAVRTLNEGVAKGYPTVLLLAGAMFESGTCLKPSWARAAEYYQRADAAGHPRAAARLASGYAAPVGGPDKAAAMWWALRSGAALPEACRSVAPLVEDSDRFVAALKGWPAALVDACTYVVGVTSTIGGDVEFSNRAEAFGIKGTLTLVFEPARDAIELNTQSIDFIQLDGVVSGNTLLDRQSKNAKQDFERDIRAAAERALKRYPKPAGIDPSWKMTQRFVFDYVTR